MINHRISLLQQFPIFEPPKILNYCSFVWYILFEMIKMVTIVKKNIQKTIQKLFISDIIMTKNKTYRGKLDGEYSIIR